jgi:hypothetical protein
MSINSLCRQLSDFGVYQELGSQTDYGPLGIFSV